MFFTILFAGPSGVGKSFVGEILAAKHPKAFEQVKLFTTRDPRKNEKTTDRIFLTNEKFQEMVGKGAFEIHSEFAGNLYGFTKKSLVPHNKHLLGTAWPWLTPRLCEYENIVIVGMQPPKNKNILIERMIKRGESKLSIKKRIKLIDKDVADLEEHKELINKHGKFFEIKDDSTVEKEIIPWIEKKLDLQA